MSLHYSPSFNYLSPRMETRWLSVIKPEDSFSGNQITALWRDVLIVWVCACVYTCDLIAMCISLSQHVCLSLKTFIYIVSPDNETWVIISVWWYKTTIEQQVYKWRSAEQYGGGLAEWHHAEIIDYCPATMAEGEKQITFCVRVSVYVSTLVLLVHLVGACTYCRVMQ